MTCIVGRLYLAGIEELVYETQSHILNVASELTFYRSVENKYLHRHVGDDDISVILDECADWIHNALSSDLNVKVMVHC